MPGLTSEQLEFFHTEGYVHVPNAFGPEDLDPVQAELERIVDTTARRLVAEGKVDQEYTELPFDKRLTRLCGADSTALSGIDFPANLGRNIFNFLHNDRLLDLVESLVGTEIYSNPCQHIRPLLPAGDKYAGALCDTEWYRGAPWHQDRGVLLPEADETLVITTWIPLVDADATNGALSLIPRRHHQPLLTHELTPARNLRITPDALPDTEPVTVPVKRGSLLMFHCLTPHMSYPNRSDGVRWTLDLRWNDARKPNGRPHLPGLLVRSQEEPEMIQTHEEWLTAWKLARISSRGARGYRWS